MEDKVLSNKEKCLIMAKAYGRLHGHRIVNNIFSDGGTAEDSLDAYMSTLLSFCMKMGVTDSDEVRDIVKEFDQQVMLGMLQ